MSNSTVENVDGLAARIDVAATIMDVDDIAISTNGGFHVVGSAAAESEHAKLQLVEMVARYVWGNEL
ncbi:hypothetical protein DFQ14_102402 [Halopolyspora algeriensis]|uniref:Uncharacterized protein n=1 Tax=Halopolyspora algeriensis TaxID=1500506 RepID=A0A368VXL6_9ACTN|nr:hypothetical protein [Halopolyspora algeriensis]RCW46100.1 hypothetical protein DFQ14_102402 [Halopolyspora algeriensis]